MTRTSPSFVAPLVVTALCVCAGFVIIGCSQSSSSPTNTTGSGGAGTGSAAPAGAGTASPFATFVGWDTDPPAAVLAISGQQDGYLEPCGCTEGQKGGLGRRMDFFQKLKARGWNVVPVELGGLIKDPTIARGGLTQSKIKFGVSLQSLALLGYQTLTVSAEDFKLGVIETLGYLANRDAALPLVSANIAVKPEQGFPNDLFQKSRILTAGNVKIGITAVTDPADMNAVTDQDKSTYLDIKPIAEALPPVLKDLESASAFQVVLVQGSVETAKAVAAANPGVEIVVATSTAPDPDMEPIALNNGATLLIQVGRKGTYIGAVGYFPEKTPKFRYQRVVLGKSFNQAPPMRKLLDVDYQNELKANGVVEQFVKRPNADAPAGSTYVGYKTCQVCHPVTVTFWANTKHAHAFESLTKDPARPRIYDAECITCHTTGFEHTSGYVSEQATSHLKGNQCENCHGPGSRHSAEPDNLEFRKAVKLVESDVEKNHFCLKCHDDDNSPTFQFKDAFPKIKHSKMDRYDDPKVHKGVTAPVKD